MFWTVRWNRIFRALVLAITRSSGPHSLGYLGSGARGRILPHDRIDCLFNLLLRDAIQYDHVYKKLIAAASLADVSAGFPTERIKYETTAPVP